MNASLAPSNDESGQAGLKPELKKGAKYHKAHVFAKAKANGQVRTVPVVFQKVVFFDDLGITLND